MADKPLEESPEIKRGSSDPHALFGLGFDASAKSSGKGVDWVAPTIEELQRGLPQYEIISMIACGGMGAVYKARQNSLDRLVAIKILPTEMEQGDADFAERFKREAQAMARLTHPGIVAVHDAGETTGGLLYFVMDFVEGTDVRQMVAARGSLPQDEALGITAHVCEALAYAHSKGIIHRDIKPSNVIVDTEGRVRIADFGVAKMTSTDSQRLMTASNVALGTAEFMAPEAMSGSIHVDHRADLYAVGVMLYQMLTGKIPRGRFDPASRLVPGLDRRIDRVIDRTLQSEPAARYSSAGELSTALAPVIRWRGSSPITARVGKSRRTQLFVAAGVMAALGVAGWFLQKGRVATVPAGAPVAPARVSEAPTSFVAATKAAPFINSLGMKFVPVPITGGPTGGQRVLFSVWETRVQDYELFVHGTRQDWPKPSFEQGPTHPAVNVSWADAQAFCAWLTEQERSVGRLDVHQRYRLPGDHEWSCAVGLGDREDPARSPADKAEELTGIFPWGDVWPPPRGAGNYSGAEAAGHETWGEQVILSRYRDPFPETAPVGSFAANQFGIFDLGGNVWEWCEDFFQPGQLARTQRGASFNNGSRGGLFSAKRDHHPPATLSDNFGFRVVLVADQTR